MLVMIDNALAVAYVNHLGGTKSVSLIKLMIQVGVLTRALNCNVRAKHIVGRNNVLADLASRLGQIIPQRFSIG